MTNFTFIKTDFPELFTDAIKVDQLIFIYPKAVAFLMCSVLENSVACFFMYNRNYKLNNLPIF